MKDFQAKGERYDAPPIIGGTVELFVDPNGAGLVFPGPTGVTYSFQVGGLGCSHPEVEGFYVPIRALRVLRSVLESRGDLDGSAFFPSFYPGHELYGQDGQDAAGKVISALGLDSCLEAPLPEEADRLAISTNNTWWSEIGEAWIPIKVRTGLIEDHSLSPVTGRVGILTYPNSD